jgi:glycosyltransferase involved in cell wall biosynthesis
MPGEASLHLDLQGAQNRAHFDRGIPRYINEVARETLRQRPEGVAGVGLNPRLPLGGNLAWLFGSGLARWTTSLPPERLPRIYHVMSPFEMDRSIDEIWPHWARRRGCQTVVTLYDLIPLVFEQHYLRDPAWRAQYLARTHLVRAADHVLAISEATAADAEARLGVSRDRITVVDAGVTGAFASLHRDEESAWRTLREDLPQVRPGFMVYVSGIEFRKNNERLIEAYAGLDPRLRRRHQLVLVCRMDAAARDALEGHARHHGIQRDELIMPGYVSDSQLAALYRACRLFVFASFYEGSGLPILEAMACGAPVAAANTSTTPEILGDSRATFDPFDPADITRCLRETLPDEDLLSALRERSRRRVPGYTWENVAARSLDAYDNVLARRRGHSRRPRLAWFSPWPPEQSGIANYSRNLLQELGRDVDVDVVVAEDPSRYPAPLEPGVRLVPASMPAAFRTLRSYDRIVYCMGNSSFHRHVYEAIRERPGMLVAHDVRLTGFYGWYAGIERPGDPSGRLAERLAEMYAPRIDAAAFSHRPPTPQEQTALGLFMTRELQELAESIIVHSRFAADIVRLDAAVERPPAAPVHVLPLAVAPREHQRHEPDPAAPHVASFGVLSEVKGLATLIDAFAIVAGERAGARLTLMGPAEAHEAERWRRRAADVGVGERVSIPGFGSSAAYEQLLRDADVAVQLRTITNGEASAAVCDCLGAGVPTIITGMGWADELPRDAVERVPLDVSAARLAAEIGAILDDSDHRHRLERGASDYAAATTYADVAQRYLEVLELG